MKKLQVCLLLIFAFLFAGCSEQSVEPELISGGSETTVADDSEETGYYFVYDSVTLTPGDKWDLVKDSFKEEYTSFESASCAYEGMDRIYTFKSIAVHTYEKDSDNIEIISGIDVTSENATSPEGLQIGMDATQIRELMGEPDDEYTGAFVYTEGSTQLNLYLENNVLTTFSYEYTGE